MKVSVVKNHTQTTGLIQVEICDIFKSIKTGGKQLDLILELRRLTDAKAADAELKKQKSKLAAIMFGGEFRERNNAGLIKASGLMILDFDESEVDLAVIQEYIYAIFKSPSGRGWKVLIRIPEVKSDAEYKTYFFAVQKTVPQIDPSGKDIARLCYFSFDDDLKVFNWDEVKVWTEKIVSATVNENNFKKKVTHTDVKHLTVAMAMITNSMVGNRHNTMLRAGRLIGGYVAAGEVDEAEAKNIIHTHIEHNSPDDYRDHIRAFNDAIEHGKKDPFKKKEIKDIEEEVERLGTLHITVDEALDEMNHIYENGLPRGYKLGWSGLDKHYTLLLGSTTYLYSSAYSGKTQFWNEGLINLSKFYGMRHAIFSPETGNAAEIYMELARIYMRKDFKKAVMTELEREEAYYFLRNHFVVIDGDFFDKDLTVKDVCDYVTLLERKYNQKIHTLTIDPWNELKHNYDNRQDLKLEEELKYVRKHAKNNERHVCVVTHVRDQDGQYDKEGGFTYYHLPTFRDVAGGQTWSRKGMMMMAVWRPVIVKRDNNSEEFQVAGRTIKKNQLIVQVQKAKPKGYGAVGEIDLFYHPHLHSYTDSIGNHAVHPDQQFIPIQNTLTEEKEELPW